MGAVRCRQCGSVWGTGTTQCATCHSENLECNPMISFNCMLARGLDRRHWVQGDCVVGDSPEDAVKRYCRILWENGSSEIENGVPMLIRAVDDEDAPHEFHVTPKFEPEFDIEPWAQS